MSQVIVEDAGRGNRVAGQSAGSNSSAAPSNDVIVDLYFQLQALQREVQSLRGMVEEQVYRMRQMEGQQQSRYLDIDNRLRELAGGGTGAANPGNGGSSSNPASNLGAGPGANVNPADVSARAIGPQTGPRQNTPGADAPSNANNTPVPTTEDELYRLALSQLLEAGEYERSVSLFQQQIEDYPEGRLLPNAYYWQGEALILVERYNQAISVFNEVIDRFPQHNKAPDAMLKLGIVYSLMGNQARANETWRSISVQYPSSDSAAVRLAEEYLREGYRR